MSWLVGVLVALGGGVPWLAEKHVQLMCTVHEIVRVGAASVCPDECEHATLHFYRQLDSPVTPLAPLCWRQIACFDALVGLNVVHI